MSNFRDLGAKNGRFFLADQLLTGLAERIMVLGWFLLSGLTLGYWGEVSLARAS